ncbi:MAG: hypothetical protein WC322_07030 [Candidatus Paceibacterota bacterium]|jgi:hypothetical protein
MEIKKERVIMKKVEMSTKINVNGSKVQTVQEFAARRLEEVASYGSAQFVIVGDDAYLGNNSSGEAAYFAHAVRLGDVIAYGWAPLYLIEFEIVNSETEDGNDACDWSVVSRYEEDGTIEVE